MPSATTRIGSGAGFAGDRIGPAVDLARRGALDDLVLECLAERTIALGHRRRLADPATGYDPRLGQRLTALLPDLLAGGVRLLTNMGAANPPAAGRVVREHLDRLGSAAPVAVVTGDDVLDVVDPAARAAEDGVPLHEHGELVSANAYLGADAIAPALDTGAAVVVTGRVADPSLFLAPLAHRLGWDLDHPDEAAAGTLVGHLLECAGQLTGGYAADPGHLDVPRLADLGFPFADVVADGTARYGKLDGTGGRLDRHTVREQLLYEVTDPTGYRTPDVVLDLRGVSVDDDGPDRVRVTGATGRARPDELKVSVGYRAGHRVEAGISYVGPNAAARARLAADVVAERVRGLGVAPRIEVRGGDTDARLRVAALHHDPDVLDVLAHEVEALYTNGPAGGGGVRTRLDEVVGVLSTLVPRAAVVPRVTVLEAGCAAA
ncbi:acyclic terpene utilization AtuA family protein [Pseudonocardia alni]|uniref:acyclic terpene utilization AtuA family protein n=1 Tax=Pseudonocardia alni TaxID=33907 RepID=UPI00280BE507|nr:acyclic terpene utilization AtuA family protein [Pseudonocardia alni]